MEMLAQPELIALKAEILSRLGKEETHHEDR
jgi:hypothetical protein